MSAREAEMETALSALAQFRNRPYYDREADETIRSSYYSGINDEGTGADLRLKLSQRLQNTHQPQLIYRPHVHLYPWVDLQPDGNLRSIYTGHVYEPRELIEEAFVLEEERELRRASEELRTLELRVAEALIESTLPYNCEHSVPQSWFGYEEPMRGDLHHLFTCESRCNSFRGNSRYFDFVDFREVIREDCGKRTDEGFEPVQSKGIVARASLYFILRYPTIHTELNSGDSMQMLLDWHQENQVSDYERHRNVAIHEAQRNRNPLVDFPEWAERIDFQVQPT